MCKYAIFFRGVSCFALKGSLALRVRGECFAGESVNNYKWTDNLKNCQLSTVNYQLSTVLIFSSVLIPFCWAIFQFLTASSL